MSSFVKKVLLVTAILILLTASLFVFARQTVAHYRTLKYSITSIPLTDASNNSSVELGERIVRVRNGCIDCHGEDLGGKLVLDDSAMGRFYSANITPFSLSQWSDQEIATAIRNGLKPNGVSLLFMPSYEFSSLSKEDMASVIAYLRRIPAVHRKQPPSEIGLLSKLLFSFGQMPVLFPATVADHKKGYPTKPEEGPTRDFGQYLVENACVGCHGPEKLGGKIPGGPPDWPPAPNLRLGQDPTWTETNFFEAMRAGISKNSKKPLQPPMPVALTSKLNDTELKAMWLYLSSLK